MSALFVFGMGYSAELTASLLSELGWQIMGTGRSPGRLAELASLGFSPVPFSDRKAVSAALATTSHLLISTPPVAGVDPAYAAYADEVRQASSLKWIGYLSTIGVYGNHDGAWVDETTPVAPDVDRSRARVEAEREWMDVAASIHMPVDIFRLGGIYGPRRSPLDRVAEGRAQRVIKPGQIFNRIHVEDIAQTVVAAILQPAETVTPRVFNVTDDLPAPPQEVTAFAAELLNRPPPEEVAFEDAVMSPMARSFYEDNKRVRNSKIKTELGVSLRYPTYREGLKGLAEAKA